MDKDQYIQSENVTIQCDSKYKLVGPQSITCLESRTWYPEMPKCEWVSGTIQKKYPVLSNPKNEASPQALFQPAMVRSDLSGVIWILQRNSLFSWSPVLRWEWWVFLFHWKIRKSWAPLVSDAWEYWVLTWLFLDYLIDCVPFLDGLRHSLYPHRSPLRSCLRTGPYPSGENGDGTCSPGSPGLGLDPGPVVLSLSEDTPNPAPSWSGEKPLNPTHTYVSFRWSLKAVNISSKAERRCSVSPTQRMWKWPWRYINCLWILNYWNYRETGQRNRLCSHQSDFPQKREKNVLPSIQYRPLQVSNSPVPFAPPFKAINV